MWLLMCVVGSQGISKHLLRVFVRKLLTGQKTAMIIKKNKNIKSVSCWCYLFQSVYKTFV